MYKYNFRKWGIGKNTRGQDVGAILSLKAKRDLLRKPSEFQKGGRVVDLQRCKSYLKRKGLNETDLMLAVTSTLPEGLVCRTPSPKPVRYQDLCVVPRSLNLPDSLEYSERIHWNIQDYITRSFESGIWHCNQHGTFSRTDDRDKDCSFEEFKRIFHLAIDLYPGSLHFWGKLTRKAFLLVPRVLQEEHPLTVIQIFALFKVLISLDQGVFESLLFYLEEYSRILFKPQHQLRVIFAHMAQIYETNPQNVDQINTLIHDACRGTLDGFVRMSGPSEYGVIPLRVAYLKQTKIEEPEIISQLTKTFSALLEKSDSHRDGKGSIWSLDISYWWTMFAEHRADLELCENLSNDMIQRAGFHERDCSDRRCWYGQRGLYAGYETLADIYKLKGRFDEAEGYLRNAIAHRIKYDGIRGRLHATSAVNKMIRLYGWLTKRGELLRAKKTETELMKLLQPSIQEVDEMEQLQI